MMVDETNRDFEETVAEEPEAAASRRGGAAPEAASEEPRPRTRGRGA